MEKVFTKLLGKCWIIYRGRDLAQHILRQICIDARAHLRWVVSAECALMDLDEPKMVKSKSTSNLLKIKRTWS
jgi:hypothetical protein